MKWIKTLLIFTIVFSCKSQMSGKKIKKTLSGICNEAEVDVDRGDEFGILNLTKIGKGAYGDVYLYNDNTVVKRIEIKQNGDLHYIKNEITTLRSTENFYDIMSIHPGDCLYQTVPLANVPENEKIDTKLLKIYLFLEKKGSDLYKVVKTRKSYTKQIMWILDMCIKTTKALMNLHSLNLVHRDIKPQNYLIGEDPDTMVVTPILNDFDLTVENNKKHSSIGGTRFYKAPESDSGEVTKTPQDVFSLGRLFYFLMNPIVTINSNHTEGIKCNNQNYKASFNPYYCKFFEPFIESMFNRDPSKRPILTTVLETLLNARIKIDKFIVNRAAEINNKLKPAACCTSMFTTNLSEQEKNKLKQEAKGLNWSYQKYLTEERAIIDQNYNEDDAVYQSFYQSHPALFVLI